jgi:hypothetical protein
MASLKKIKFDNEKGFVLLAAIIACLILLAVGMLVINMTAGNLFISAETVGNKKAFAAAESGILIAMQDFKAGSENWTDTNNYTQDCSASLDSAGFLWRTINTGADAKTKFITCRPSSIRPPIPIYGDAGVSLCIYDEMIIGRNTSYNSLAKVDIGIGVYCPGVSTATPTTYR